MGGIMKGGHGHMHAAYSSSRRRWINVYVVMVIVCLVFGCGILGLMGLHRLKDTRILNLLIKEKDDQILSLHHLLQKEREHMQEVKRKTEEMKVKIFSLRAEKTELNGRVLDMQSTISSLKEEQRIIELAFQEKQNEAKLLREQYIQVKDQNPQVKALMVLLRQKEAEIEDLKHHLQFRGANVGSVSTDEHSIIPANITAKANISGSETMIDENKNRDMHDEERKNRADEMESTRNDASRYKETESSMQSEEHRENGRSITGRSETTIKQEFDRLGNSQERNAENERANADRRSGQVETKDNYDHDKGGSLETGQEKKGGSLETGQEKNGYETEKMGNLGNEEQKRTDEDSETSFTDSKEIATMGDTHSRRISKSQGSDNQELRVHKGLVKMEMQENSHSRHYRFRGKHGYLKRAMGKRWRSIAKQTEGKRNSQSNGALTMGVQGMEEIGNKLEEGKPRNQDKIQNSIMRLRMQNESVLKSQHFEIDDKLPHARHGEDMSNVKGSIEENNGEDSPPGIKSRKSVKPEDTEDMSHKVAKFDMSNQFENGWKVTLTNSSSEKSHISLDEVPKHSAVKMEDTGSSNKGAVQHTEEDEQSKQQEITIREHREDKNDPQNNNHLGRKEVAETNEDPDGIQTEDFEESELGEDNEDKEQADEPEF